MNQYIGICSWTLGINDIEELFKKVSDYGMNAIQYCEPIDIAKPNELKSLSKKYSLKILAYDPFDCRPKDNEQKTPANAVKKYSSFLKYAKELDVPLTTQGLCTWIDTEKNQEQQWIDLCTSFVELGKMASENGVSLILEPCNLYEIPLINTVADYHKLKKDTDLQKLCLLMDAFHLNIGESSPLEVFEESLNENMIFHISNSNRGGIGFGHVDFLKYAEAMKRKNYKGSSVLEVILPTNPVNTPPRNQVEWSDLDIQIKSSVEQWLQWTK